jgi:C1A family cysteine protease
MMLLAFRAYPQAPNSFKYQALARDNTGKPLIESEVSLQISILAGSKEGEVVYTENHEAITNAYGLINIEIGNGKTEDDFSLINWAKSPFFLKVELDPEGGSNFELMGVSQLLSVPYAKYADIAGNTNINTSDTSATNELQMLSISNDTIYLENGGFVKLPANNGQYYYADEDNDGYGNEYNPVWVPAGTNAPTGFILNAADCNDKNENIYPGAIEICGDEIDQDCNGNDLSCDNQDKDDDGDGYSENQGDCNDADSTIHPGATEIFDSIDNDCDGIIDSITLQSFDCRNAWPNSITPVKNQEQCGACYVFASEDMVEARANILASKTGGPMPQFNLSTQHIISCGGNYQLSYGCDGGNALSALYFIRDSGVVYETCYPYQESNTPDCTPCSSGERVKIDSCNAKFPNSTPNSVFINTIKQEIYDHGPVVMVIDVHNDFLSYTSGIYDVLNPIFISSKYISIIGWGNENETDYWICKNTWGTSWGENGYFKINILSSAIDYSRGYYVSYGYFIE